MVAQQQRSAEEIRGEIETNRLLSRNVSEVFSLDGFFFKSPVQPQMLQQSQEEFLIDQD